MKFALFLIALMPLSVFAMGKKPPTAETLKKLYTQNFQCEVVSAERRTNGELTDQRSPDAPKIVVTRSATYNEGKLYKSIDAPLHNPDIAGPTNTPAVGAEFELSEDTVQQYDEDALILSSSASMWDRKSLEINLKTGEGKLEVDVTWGWDQRHDTEEAIFKNCKAL